MKANFPNQRATKTRNTTVAMTTPTIPSKPVKDISVLGGLKCEGKAVWRGENKIVKSKVGKKKCYSKAWLVVAVLPGIARLFKGIYGTDFYHLF
jgi:hypothetical protein